MEYIPYPRSLYRQDDNAHWEHVFDGVKCAVRTVESEEEEEAAKAEGWFNSPAEAGAGVAEEPKSPRKPKSELAILREQFKAATGKNPSPRATVEQLQAALTEAGK